MQLKNKDLRNNLDKHPKWVKGGEAQHYLQQRSNLKKVVPLSVCKDEAWYQSRKVSHGPWRE
jgi:hypothetical protein